MARKAINELVFHLDNGAKVCAWQEYGIRMGEGFLNALTEPPVFKDYVTNEYALEDGVRITAEERPYVKSRELTLTITIEGDTPGGLQGQRQKFLEFITASKGKLVVSTADAPDVRYTLYLKGRGGEYNRSLDRCFCKMALKFVEPNPAAR